MNRFLFSLSALLIACAPVGAGVLRVNVSDVRATPAALMAGESLTVSYTLSGAGLYVPGGLSRILLDFLRQGTVIQTISLYPGEAGTARGANQVAIDSSGVPAGQLQVRVTVVGQDVTAPDFFELPTAADEALQFASPRGVDVNRVAGSSAFGRIYVTEGAAGATANRSTVEGVYALNPDLTPAFADARARNADIGSLGPWASSSNSPFRVTVGPDAKVYITDASDPHAALFVADADVSAVRPFFAYPYPAGGARALSGLVTDGSGAKIHGSISSVWVESAGGSTSVYTTDEDLNPGNSLWRRNVPTDSTGNAAAPSLAAATPGANWVQDVVRDSGGNSYVVSLTADDAGKYNAAGAKVSTLASNAVGYYGACIDDASDTILLASNDGRVFQTNRDFTDSAALFVGLGAELRDVAMDAQQWVYALDATNHRLHVFVSPGDYSVLGSQATSAGSVLVSSPLPGDVTPVGASGKYVSRGGVGYGDDHVDLTDAVTVLRIALGLTPGL
ncbi:MAG TPA: hypothetical protein VGM37_02300 [Armatimonadota bacterium]|jgi:hypothetical protein